MKNKDIKNLDMKGLGQKAKELKDQINDLIMDKHMNKLKDIKAIAKSRKELAQVLTVFRQKQLLEEKGTDQ